VNLDQRERELDDQRDGLTLKEKELYLKEQELTEAEQRSTLHRLLGTSALARRARLTHVPSTRAQSIRRRGGWGCARRSCSSWRSGLTNRRRR
jgi:hypothetical protein